MKMLLRMTTSANHSSRGLLSRASQIFWGTIGTVRPLQTFPYTLLCNNRFICRGPFHQSDLFTCLFEMITLIFTNVWNRLWHRNEIIKVVELSSLESETAASTQLGFHYKMKLWNTSCAYQVVSYFWCLHWNAAAVVSEYRNTAAKPLISQPLPRHLD